ncbi:MULTISPECIES: SEL1-like repeat protein, partial [unclassified Gilliamella]|nr:SEL1-like repeat protein [Gilliamella sp. B3771]MCX8614955.1 SEL1-like repeat protein [Gilliamella sp. B3770]MCX8627232.1 SEL1-like repeat protein [Gilliamella sp. B3976]
GDREAQYNLAFMYYNGDDVEENTEKALYWLTQAAEQGVSVAQYG